MIQIDTNLFYWINRHHCAVADWVLWTASQSWSWIVVLLLFFVFGTLLHEPRKWWLVAVGIGVCFLLSDRISVLCFKDVFCRPRPCHALENVRMFRTTCGGAYGFVSSHAANVFALALFLALRQRKWETMEPRKKCKRWIYPTLLFGWALLVGYSRPYLGKHYPGDVLCGALLGLVLGWLTYLITNMIEKRVPSSPTPDSLKR